MTNPSKPEIPATPEAITAKWLTRAVAEFGADNNANSVELVDAHSGTTGRARIKVAWQGSGLPEHIFVKLAPTDPFQRAVAVDTGMGAREAQFYRELATEVPVRAPVPYLSLWTADGREYVMLIEDLEAAGCSFPGFASNADPAIVRSTLDGLARLHAAFWKSPRLATDLFWIEPPMHSELGPELVAAGVSSFGDAQPAAFHDLADLYVNHGNEVAKLLAAGPQTLLHGDAHLGNLFLENDRVGFLDWACVCKGPALRDVAYFLCGSVDTGLRRAEQEAFVEYYLAALARSGGPHLDFEDAWRDYRRFVAAGWIASVATLAVGAGMQSIAVGEAAVARANAAVGDLDTASLLREELGL